jgi:hypothetical protein
MLTAGMVMLIFRHWTHLTKDKMKKHVEEKTITDVLKEVQAFKLKFNTCVQVRQIKF